MKKYLYNLLDTQLHQRLQSMQRDELEQYFIQVARDFIDISVWEEVRAQRTLNMGKPYKSKVMQVCKKRINEWINK